MVIHSVKWLDMVILSEFLENLKENSLRD